MDMKKCSKCGSVMAPSGKAQRIICHPCNRQRATQYRLANIEQIRQKDRVRTAETPIEKRREKHRKWREANRDHVREKGRETMRRLYAANPDKFRAASREFARKNPEYVKKKNANRDPEVQRKRAAEYRIRNAEIVAKKNREYQARPEAKAKARKQKSLECLFLADSYVSKVLSPDAPQKSIPAELIEAKRVHLQIHRLLRDMTK